MPEVSKEGATVAVHVAATLEVPLITVTCEKDETWKGNPQRTVAKGAKPDA